MMMIKVLKGLACKTKIKFKNAYPNLWHENEQRVEMATAWPSYKVELFWSDRSKIKKEISFVFNSIFLELKLVQWSYRLQMEKRGHVNED